MAGVDLVTIPWCYAGAARDLVLALKLRAQRAAATPLAAAVAGRLQRSGTRAEVVTWVPGRPADVRARGFDHAHAIAREVGGATGLPVARCLDRVRDRPDQTTLSATQRRANLRGAFAATDAASHVLLIDDLVTTGATAGACAVALRDRGATYIQVAAPCRV